MGTAYAEAKRERELKIHFAPVSVLKVVSFLAIQHMGYTCGICEVKPSYFFGGGGGECEVHVT